VTKIKVFRPLFCVGMLAKSAAPLNEVRIPRALPEYYIKYSQNENAKSDYFNRFKGQLIL